MSRKVLLKFYTLHKFNAMVKKGKFDYSTLAKIYCVGILAKNINPYEDYLNVSNLRNEKGELIDDQMTFVTVELDKFTLQDIDCQTDLQKLIYTMRTIHTITQPTQFPKFWDEEWLKVTIDELDSRKMTPDEKASLEMLIARNAESVKAESKKIKQAVDVKTLETVTKALAKGLDIQTVADIADVSTDFVLSVQRQLSIN